MRGVFFTYSISLSISVFLFFLFHEAISIFSPNIFLILLAPSLIISAIGFHLSFYKFSKIFKVKNQSTKIQNLKYFLYTSYAIVYIVILSTNLYFIYYSHPAAIKSINQISKNISDNYSLEISYNCTPINNDIISVKNINTNTKEIFYLSNCYNILANELSKYPKFFFRRINLKYIYAGKNILFKNEAAGALVSHEDNFILLDGTIDAPLTQRENIHHEIAHTIHNYLVNKNSKIFEKWKKLNPENFKYLGNLSNYNAACAQDPLTLLRATGFASSYSITNVKEDFSETYELLMSSKSNRKLLTEYIKKDEILNSKVSLLIDTLRDEMGIFIEVEESIRLVHK